MMVFGELLKRFVRLRFSGFLVLDLEMAEKCILLVILLIMYMGVCFCFVIFCKSGIFFVVMIRFMCF